MNEVNQPVRSAYQPPANSTFLSERISHPQPASSTLLSKQTSTNHQPPANRTGSKSFTFKVQTYQPLRKAVNQQLISQNASIKFKLLFISFTSRY
jgi:hypothetical protein